jgi:hypothetical protein
MASQTSQEARKYQQAEWAGRIVFAVTLLVGLSYLIWGPPTAYRGQVSQSMWDRAFSNSVLDLLRVAVVVLAAYVVGGVAQRLWLGEFGFEASVFKLAPVVKRFERAAEDINTAVAQATEKLQTQTSARFDKLAGLLEKLTDSVAKLQERLDALEAEEGVRSDHGDPAR